MACNCPPPCVVFSKGWHRFADVKGGDKQFPGWPITFKMEDNDGRKATHHLPDLALKQENVVVQAKRDGQSGPSE